jgi:6-phosphofructokinase 1
MIAMAFEESQEDIQIQGMLAGEIPIQVDPGRLDDKWSRRVDCRDCAPDFGPFLGGEDRRALTARADWLMEFVKLTGRIPGFLAAGPRQILHFDPARLRVGVLTSGGVCPGVNTVVDALVRRHSFYAERLTFPGSRGTAVLGFQNGFRGLIEGKFIELTPFVTENWPRHGGTVLRTVREKDKEYPPANLIVDALNRFNLDILYVIGGDGSLSKARDVTALLGAESNIAVVHIPKTMDNDLPWITESFGFQTAIAEAARLVNAIRDEAESNNRIAVVEVLGAGMGHTAAHTALGSGEVDLVLIPELGPIDFAKVLDHLDRCLLAPRAKGYAVILASERVQPDLDLSKPEDSEFLQKLGKRYNVPDLANRVFVNQPRHFIRAVPANCHDQLYCRLLSDCAVDCALAGYTGFSSSKWLDNYVMVPFARAAGFRKHLPLEGMIWKQIMNLTGQGNLA